MEEANTQEWLNPTARWLVFFDLESTCSDDHGGLVIGRGEGEAIELGAVVIDLEGKTWPRGFRTLARPIGNPILTGRCTRLTTITQAQVDAAPSFPRSAARGRPCHRMAAPCWDGIPRNRRPGCRRRSSVARDGLPSQRGSQSVTWITCDLSQIAYVRANSERQVVRP